MPDYVKTKGQISGYLRKDQFGRVIIDTCKTDEDHLLVALPEGQERRVCREYLDDIMMIPETYLGKRVYITYDIRIESEETYAEP